MSTYKLLSTWALALNAAVNWKARLGQRSSTVLILYLKSAENYDRDAVSWWLPESMAHAQNHSISIHWGCDSVIFLQPYL